MLKLLGICLVMAGCAGCGWYLSGKTLYRIRLLEEWDRLLQLLYSTVEYAGSDMLELIGYLEHQSHYTKDFWRHLRESLQQEYPERFRELWQKELSRMDWHAMGQDERALLEELGAAFGQTDRKTQLQTLKLYRERLEMIQKQTSESYRGQSKIYHVAGITAGCFLVILLL